MQESELILEACIEWDNAARVSNWLIRGSMAHRQTRAAYHWTQLSMCGTLWGWVPGLRQAVAARRRCLASPAQSNHCDTLRGDGWTIQTQMCDHQRSELAFPALQHASASSSCATLCTQKVLHRFVRKAMQEMMESFSQCQRDANTCMTYCCDQGLGGLILSPR